VSEILEAGLMAAVCADCGADVLAWNMREWPRPVGTNAHYMHNPITGDLVGITLCECDVDDDE
jgi:hypothetical protein